MGGLFDQPNFTVGTFFTQCNKQGLREEPYRLQTTILYNIHKPK